MFFFLKLNNLFEYLTGFLATPENPPCIIMFFHEGRNWRLPSPTQPQMLWDTRWQPKTYQINACFSRKRFDVTFLGKKNSYGIELVLLFRADVSTVFFSKKKVFNWKMMCKNCGHGNAHTLCTLYFADSWAFCGKVWVNFLWKIQCNLPRSMKKNHGGLWIHTVDGRIPASHPGCIEPFR